MNLLEKVEFLKELLRRHAPVAIAFSGGVDSAFLLRLAAETLPATDVLAITVRADNFPEWELREAEALARRLGVRQEIVEWDILALPEFVANPPDRCYFCKKSLFGLAILAAEQWGASGLLDGANADDVLDYRPGQRAAMELGVVSPLREAGLGKAEIRALLREQNLPLADKPSFACLASRIPYGIPITRDDLLRVEAAESFLRNLGFRNIRVRHHGEVARIEVDPDERNRFFSENLWEKVDAELARLGYLYSALDLRGYRTGSLNASLSR